MATLTLAILFFIFTGNMYLDAMSSIRTNTTGNDLLIHF